MPDRRSYHERLTAEEPAPAASNRLFGVAVAVALSVVGLLPLAFGEGPRIWALAAAGAVLLIAIIVPAALAPLNRIWAKVAGFLHRFIITPLLMGVLFYGVVTPTGLARRLFRKDSMRRRWDPDAPTYWLRREPPGPSPDTMKNQF